MNDSMRTKECCDAIEKLVRERPQLVKHFGDCYRAEDDDRYWQWWEFAVFDGTAWQSFHLKDNLQVQLESHYSADDDAERRERAGEAVLKQFEIAAALL
ncbi:MAG: hypothetical protein ACYDAG_14305 [Chloroflexota bacterium]